MSFDICFRVVVLGAARVGKTCIISRLLSKTFDNKYRATVADFRESEVWLDDVRLKLAIIDTAGSYAFPAMNRVSIGAADGIVLVYSLDDPASFREMIELRRQVGEQRREIPIVVVGNKNDLQCQRPVVDGATTASKEHVDWNRSYLETSAKNDVNIGRIFTELISQDKRSADLIALRRRSSAARRDRSKLYNCCTVS